MLKYWSLKETIKKNGVLTTIDFAISEFLEIASKRFYRPRSADYGLSEVLFYSKRVDHFENILKLLLTIGDCPMMFDVLVSI